jgi:outer membrane protein assembly factor BamB
MVGLLLASVLATKVEAKRGAPKDVPPVTQNGVVYSAPHDQMGCVVAKDEKTGKQLWSKQVYTVKYDPNLEKDVQDCFISELRFADGKLIVSNERGGQFELDPATQAVKVLKGTPAAPELPR